MPIINPSPGSTTIIQTTIQGSPGLDGDPGEDGLFIPGSAGPAGANGSSGVQGVPGVTIFVEDGLSGEDSFIPGPQGIQGIQGTNGTIGRDGAKGLDGEDGLVNDDFWPGFNPFIDDPLEQISRIQDRNLTILPNYSALVVGPYTINSGKNLTIGSGGRFEVLGGAPNAKAVVFAKQTSVYSNASVHLELMAGLGATNSSQIVVPKTSGKVFISVSGDCITATGSGTLQTTATLKLYYGVGTPPAPNDAPPIAGILIGKVVSLAPSSGLNDLGGAFSLNGVVTNLLIGVSYWFDISTQSDISSTVTQKLNDVNFSAIEL